MMTETPGNIKVEDLLEQVHDGNYVIPFFQRGFEWNPRMVCDLIQSILQDYYTGLLLLWDLDKKQASDEQWDPVWGAKLDGTPSRAILDGQQRLSSLYYAIYNPEEKFPNRKSYYIFYIDLIAILNEEYDHAVDYSFFFYFRSWNDLLSQKQSWTDSGKIPLSVLSAKDPNDNNQSYLDSLDFEKWVTEFIAERQSDLPSNISTHRVYKAIKTVLNYNFVYYPLRSERALPDICNIFARVNEKGMKLTTFDLLNAFLYPKGVILRKELWEGLNNETLKAIDPNMAEYLLKIISLIKQNYCSSKYLYNLVPGETTIRKDENRKKYEDVREIFDNPDRMKEDIKHLGNAHRKGVDVFVTSDVKDIVSKREMIERKLGIKVFHNPNEINECVNYIRNLAGQ